MNPPLCVITGARGYLGGCLTRAFLQDGWRVLGLSRGPLTPRGTAPGLTWAPFDLAKADLPPEASQADALIHCAYDFQPVRWSEISERNVAGTARLFAAARERGVKRTVLVSSMSAFPACRSLYGRAKLAEEEIARPHGALIVRPGLIYGPQPGGMVGRLLRQVQQSRLIPLVADGNQVLHLVHEEDLSAFLVGQLRAAVPAPAQPVITAHPQGWRFRDILLELARSQPRRPIFVRVPWRPAWFALRVGETLGLPLNFRSDSLLSLMHQDPSPDFPAARQAGFQGRPFSADALHP